MKNIVPAGLSGLILAFGLTTAVSAATVTVDVAGYTDLATAKADKAVIESGSTTIASEDFEGFTPVPTFDAAMGLVVVDELAIVMETRDEADDVLRLIDLSDPAHPTEAQVIWPAPRTTATTCQRP